MPSQFELTIRKILDRLEEEKQLFISMADSYPGNPHHIKKLRYTEIQIKKYKKMLEDEMRDQRDE